MAPNDPDRGVYSVQKRRRTPPTPSASPGNPSRSTLEAISKQLEEERQKTAAFREWERMRVAKEVEAKFSEQKQARRRFWVAVATVLPLIGGAFAWSISVLKEQHQKDLDENLRDQTVDTTLGTHQRFINSNKAKVEKLDTDFREYVDEKNKEDEAERFQRYRQDLNIERLLHSQGKKPLPKSPEHKEAEKAVGIDPDDPLNSLTKN